MPRLPFALCSLLLIGLALSCTPPPEEPAADAQLPDALAGEARPAPDAGVRDAIPSDLPPSPTTTTGILNPGPHDIRYRRPEYPADQPYYQWWYFNARDRQSHRQFAFAYGMIDAANDSPRESAYVYFGMVSAAEGTNLVKVERFPLANLRVEKDFDFRLGADPKSSTPEHRIDVQGDDTYRIRGAMHLPASSPAAVQVLGKLQGKKLDPAIPIEWDLTFHRIYGWYGQKPLEDLIKLTQTISWNTYAHTSEVEGTITVGGTVYTLTRQPTHRGYCDGNWGIQYPHGLAPLDKAIDYPWGWYYAGVPSADRQQEVGIIMGTGRSHSLLYGIAEGRFADVRLDATTHLEVAEVEVYGAIALPNGLKLYSTNDGTVKRFETVRDQWGPYTDDSGTYQMPYHQQITLETDHYLVQMDFFSTAGETLNLPNWHQDYIFSDFEGLGINTHVVIKRHDVVQTYQPWDLAHLFPTNVDTYTTLKDFWSDDGGVEYGYKTAD